MPTGNPTSISLNPISTRRLKSFSLRSGVHRVDQGLVAVPKVDAGPAGCPGQVAVGPGPVGQGEGAIGPVEVERHRRHVTGHGQAVPRRWWPVVGPGFWSVFMCSAPEVSVCLVLVCRWRGSGLVAGTPVPPNKKPPGRSGSGGCGRTRCGARRQVRRSSEVVAVNMLPPWWQVAPDPSRTRLKAIARLSPGQMRPNRVGGGLRPRLVGGNRL